MPIVRIKHKVYCRHSDTLERDRLPIELIKLCVRVVLRFEGVDKPCEVNVMVTDDGGIKEINGEYRGLYMPTDVLSFPMVGFSPPGWADPGIEAHDPETGRIPLGDIVFSGERAHRQANELGHTIERETAYLTVHSVLHLLGYDHVDEAWEKARMRAREKVIMMEMGN